MNRIDDIRRGGIDVTAIKLSHLKDSKRTLHAFGKVSRQQMRIRQDDVAGTTKREEEWKEVAYDCGKGQCSAQIRVVQYLI